MASPFVMMMQVTRLREIYYLFFDCDEFCGEAMAFLVTPPPEFSDLLGWELRSVERAIKMRGYQYVWVPRLRS